MCCIHFQFPFCGGIPLVIMLPFPTLALCAGLKPLEKPNFRNTETQNSDTQSHSRTLLNTWPQIFVIHAHMNPSRTNTDKDDKTACVPRTARTTGLSVVFAVVFKQYTHRLGKFSLTLSVQCRVDPQRSMWVSKRRSGCQDIFSQHNNVHPNRPNKMMDCTKKIKCGFCNSCCL